MKAFDKVPHKRLVHKLKRFGISDPYISWIEALLSNMRQRVIVNGEESEWRNITSGIPQGSILGPILFVLYINDLAENIGNNSALYLYTDDTKIFRQILTSEDFELLQEDVYDISLWSDKWLRKFHPQKCKYMRIVNANVDIMEYKLREDQVPMEQSKEEKDIGVVIDDKLTLNQHINEKVNKVNYILGVIRRSFEYLYARTFRLLYTSLVRPHLEYTNAVMRVWMGYND